MTRKYVSLQKGICKRPIKSSACWRRSVRAERRKSSATPRVTYNLRAAAAAWVRQPLLLADAVSEHVGAGLHTQARAGSHNHRFRGLQSFATRQELGRMSRAKQNQDLRSRNRLSASISAEKLVLDDAFRTYPGEPCAGRGKCFAMIAPD